MFRQHASPDAPEVPATPCACCRQPAETRVWGFDVCYPCFGDWSREAPDCGAIAATAPESDFETLTTKAGHTWRRMRPAAEEAAFEAWAKRWVAQRRTLKAVAA